jgi:hypothetical protein
MNAFFSRNLSGNRSYDFSEIGCKVSTRVGVHSCIRRRSGAHFSAPLADPTDASQSGLFRGFVLRNSDVGAAALTLDVFLFRAVCGNHSPDVFENIVLEVNELVRADIEHRLTVWGTSGADHVSAELTRELRRHRSDCTGRTVHDDALW